jgi:hypothetical protein
MAFDVTAFTADILKDVHIDDNQRQTLQVALSNPVIAKRLEDATLRQSDYSRQTAALQEKIQKSQDYWDSLVEADKRIRQRESELNRLAGDNPDLMNPDNTHNNRSVSEEKLQELAKQAVAYNNAVTRLAMQHYKEFGEILNLDDVVKTSADNGNININLAYDKFVQPKRDEANQQKVKELIEKAREEGKKEAEANFRPPTLEAPMGVQNPALDALMQKPEERSEYGQMAAVKAWREAKAKGTIINTVL